jgi:hypothetical protein
VIPSNLLVSEVPNTTILLYREGIFLPYKEFRKSIGLTILSYSMGTEGSSPGGIVAGAEILAQCYFIMM